MWYLTLHYLIIEKVEDNNVVEKVEVDDIYYLLKRIEEDKSYDVSNEMLFVLKTINENETLQSIFSWEERKWYDLDEEMKILSSHFKDYRFIVNWDWEDSDDNWKSIYFQWLVETYIFNINSTYSIWQLEKVIENFRLKWLKSDDKISLADIVENII